MSSASSRLAATVHTKLGFRTESYDVGPTKVWEVIEGMLRTVKAVALTANEVALHLMHSPNNALAILCGIKLGHAGEKRVASGGQLRLIKPWQLDESRHQALGYQYRTAE